MLGLFLSTVNSVCRSFAGAAFKGIGGQEVSGLVDVQDSEMYPDHEGLSDSMLFCSFDISCASIGIDLLRRDDRARNFEKYNHVIFSTGLLFYFSIIDGVKSL